MSRYERRHEHRRFHDYDASYDRDDITFAPPPSAAPRRSPAAVAVVGYQRPGSGHAPRDRDRDRDRDGGGGGRFTDRERDNLKRRLSIPDPGALRPHRARSLSLSTLSKITSSSSSSSSGTGSDDERWERDRGGYETQRPLVRYHHDPRLSRSSPKISLAAAGWVSSRPGSPARDRYERGFQVVERQSHSAGPSVRDLQFGVQRLGLGMEVVHGPPPPLLPSMSMVLPSSRTPVPRNASFEERNGLALRKRTGISPGHRALTPKWGWQVEWRWLVV
ncbi:hypothetical protein B0T22DRAFT_310621 [Podospora appendiculata]|uniref:Uncharacterized protein n=1 Tax=Podospora appendiculata TaxID=314037 RepID=A0AAE0WYS2_9PEZI|nr:hypothetical protein B0T22DRAFT_310621 [Podospora appendiculata]